MDRFQKFGRYSKGLFNRLTRREDRDGADLNFTTSLEEEERVISWRIENIIRCPLETGKCYESPSFCVGFSSEWTIRIYPKGRKAIDKVGIFIYKISGNSRTDIGIKYVLKVKLFAVSNEDLTEKNVFVYKNPNLYQEMDEKVEYGTDALIPSKYLLEVKSLSIICNLKVAYLDGDHGSCIAGPPISSALYHDFKEIYTSGKFSDVDVQVGKKRFPAHKAILAARSKYFAAMFDHDMKEAKDNVIVIDDIEPSVINSVLQYIYTGKVEVSKMEEAASIFSVADKYLLEELRQWCIEVILAKLSVENVCQVVTLVDMHSLPKLKAATTRLFRKYKHEILQKKEWQKIIDDKPQLASAILHAVSSDFNTYEVNSFTS